MQLNIAYLTPEYVSPESLDGGLANYIRKVALALVERKHHIVVFALSKRDRRWQDGPVTVIEVNRFENPRLPGFLQNHLNRFVPVYSRLRSAQRMARVVWKYHRKQPLDLIQVSSYMALGFTLRRNGRIPVVCRVSSYTPLCRSAYGTQRSLSEYLTDWLEIRQVSDADVAFAPSYFTSEAFARLEGFRPILLRSPLDLNKIEMDESFYRQRFSQFSYLLYFGTLSRIKGIDVIAEAIPTVLQQNPEIHFVFIGRDDGDAKNARMMDYVREKAGESHGKIHYSAAVCKAQLYPVVAHAKAILIPSRVDNYPNACLEAHSFEIPVIGTYNSSLDEMIEHEKTGLLVRNDDAKDLASGILKLLRMPEEQILEMKKNIRNHIQDVLSEDRIAQLEELYFRTIRNWSEKNRRGK